MIKTTKEAIKILTEKRGFNVEETKKWNVWNENIRVFMNDEELILYANVQARKVEEWECSYCNSENVGFDYVILEEWIWKIIRL